VGAGDYAVETLETPDFAATTTSVSVQPAPSMGSTVIPVFIELPIKAEARNRSGVVPADVDLNVPKSAFKHYRNGLKAIESKDSARAVTEFQAALQDFPDYYAARIELGRELRTEKRFQEAAEALKPLSQLAPTRPEPHVEYGLVLLGLNQTKEAVSELQTAIRLEEKSWAPHYFLGLALFDSDAEASEKEFSRALELNKQKAARAHVGLAKLCLRKGQQQAALKHLDTYLELVPNAPDAETIRKFAERLRSAK
jgi:tetratricopeptide (TPR) repeat protein